MKNLRALILAAAALFLSATAAAAPTVSLKAPANNASYLQPATFAASASATASSGTTLTKVEFYAGTTLIGTDTTSPYSISWTNVPAGVHSLTAKAWDNTGAATTSAVRTITVSAINTAPTASLSAPANNSTWVTPASITVSATAKAPETNDTIAKVEFYAGATLIGTDATSPYSISWASPPAGVHTLTAKSYDGQGGVTTSAVRTVTVNAANLPPTVSLSAPANKSSWVSPAAITVSATAKAPETNDTVAKVEFYAGATLIGTDTTSPYSISWASPPAGVHTLTAKAYDGQGGVTTSAARMVTVYAENLPPTVSLSGPANNSTWVSPASITVSATAKAPETNDTVAKVEFYAGATLIGTDTTSPYSISWASLPAGVHTLTAKAYDGQGGVTTSAARTVTVSTSNDPPSVSLTAPAAGSSYTAPASIMLAASASDGDGSIAAVEFYNGATLIGTGTLAGGSYTFTWSNVPAGSYSLRARAVDNQGASTDSAPVAVTVTDPPPPPVAAGVYYVYADHLNTPRVITDGTNKVVWRWDSDFGADAANDDPDGDGQKFRYNLRFPGQYYDKETGLHYNYFRDYDPGTGRYVQSDPIGLAGGMNVYTYVLGNPLRWTDPFGLYYYNAPPPRTQPVTGPTQASLECLEQCLRTRTAGNVNLRVSGGSEAKGHSRNSEHPKSEACDISSPKWNPGIDNGDMFDCAKQCGFNAGQFEQFTNNPGNDHWHFQLDPGNGVPAIPSNPYQLPASPYDMTSPNLKTK